MKLHLRRHPLRRDHLAERGGRHAAGRPDQDGRRAAGHQGRQGHQAAAGLSRARSITEAWTAWRERLVEYHERGARFAKWRAVIDIGDGIPTLRRAQGQRPCAGALCGALPGDQIVPIVEPEVLMDGDHDIDRCDEVTRWVLQTVFQELYEQRVALEGMVLKPNMVVPGKKSASAGLASRKSPSGPSRC